MSAAPRMQVEGVILHPGRCILVWDVAVDTDLHSHPLPESFACWGSSEILLDNYLAWLMAQVFAQAALR